MLLVGLVAACSGDPSGVATETEGPDVTSPVRITYGEQPQQFADLYLPADEATPPVVVLIHGGFWRAQYGLDLMVPLAENLAADGYAVWNIEYRRVGQPGGGWPGTLDDVAAAVDHLTAVTPEHPLDLDRVAIVGHSAGGHLALWAAGRPAIAAGDPGADPSVVPVIGIGQGPVVGLSKAAERLLGSGAAIDFLGGTPEQVPERYPPAPGGALRGARHPHADTDTLIAAVRAEPRRRLAPGGLRRAARADRRRAGAAHPAGRLGRPLRGAGRRQPPPRRVPLAAAPSPTSTAPSATRRA